jgi:hypothetical protein
MLPRCYQYQYTTLHIKKSRIKLDTRLATIKDKCSLRPSGNTKRARGRSDLKDHETSLAASTTNIAIAFVHHNQLAFWALFKTITEASLPSVNFANERYCSFTLSALSKVFTTYLLNMGNG